MASETKEHSRIVDAWIKTSTEGLSLDELINHFEETFDKLWKKSCYILSEVTLTAVMDRAIFKSSDTHRVFLELKLDPNGIQWDHFRRTTSDLKRHELIRAFSHLLTEFITISCNITGGILKDAHYDIFKTNKPKKKKP